MAVEIRCRKSSDSSCIIKEVLKNEFSPCFSVEMMILMIFPSGKAIILQKESQRKQG